MKGLTQELPWTGVMNNSAISQKVQTLCGCHLQSSIQAKTEQEAEWFPSAWPSVEAYSQATSPHPGEHSPGPHIPTHLAL